MSRNLSSILADTIAPLRAVLRPLGSPRIGIVLIAAFAMYAGLASLPLLAAAEPGGGFTRVPLRSLAWIDKTESEWFAWWPSVAMLVGIVVNMTVSMLTRVAWTWRKVPVLLTHVGVAVLALGSAVYASQKREGQIVLTAPMESAGEPAQPITEMTDGNGQNPRAIPGVSLAFRDLTIDTISGTDLARQVTLVVRAVERGVAAERAVTLNNPLVLSGLSPPTCDCLIRGPIERAWHTWINPVRWKFSIAGWDHEGWLMSREAVIAGMADRPHAGFVVLGVGNAPGVRIIGAGAVMLLLGAAWALLIATFRPPPPSSPSASSAPNRARQEAAPLEYETPPTPPPSASSPARRAHDGCQTFQRLATALRSILSPMAWANDRLSRRGPNPTSALTSSAILTLLLTAAQSPAHAANLDPASPLRTVPVQWNGRIAPLDSVARDIVRAVSGRSAVTARGGSSATEDPLTTLLDLVLDPDAVAERPIISTTGVRVPAGTPGFSNPLPRLLSIKEAERLIEAHRAVAGANTDDLRRLLPLAERLSLAKVSVRSLPLLAPARTWDPEAHVLAHHDWIDAESSLAPPPIAAAMESLRSAWRDADARRTFLAASTLSEALRQHNDGSYPKARVWFEAFMNAVAPMRWGAWLLTFAAAAGLWAFIARLREPAPVPGEPMWSEPDDPSVAGTLHSWLFGLGWLLHAVGFASRWVIAGRLPIQNQYESMLGLCLAATTAAGADEQTRTQAYADELAEMNAGARIVDRFDIAQGLPSLRSIKIKDVQRALPCSARVALPWINLEESGTAESQAEDKKLMGLQQTAERLRTYPEAVRRIEKTRLLSRHVPSGEKARQPMMFAASDVEAFDRQYVFVGSLATQLATGATSLSDKLAAVGVHPVSGPRVDGALVNVFRRSDIAKVDLQRVKALKDYPTRAGRKPAGSVTYDQTVWMTAVEAADELAMNTQQIAVLQRTGQLPAEVPPNREADNRKYFRRTAVKRLKDELASLRTIESVSSEVGLTKREFVVRFIDSGFIECVAPLGELRVQQSDIPRIHENLKRFMSAAQAGTLLNTHSRYLLNAERSGRITRAPEKETQIHGVVLFRRNDVLQMANAGEVQPIRRGVSKRLNA